MNEADDPTHPQPKHTWASPPPGYGAAQSQGAPSDYTALSSLSPSLLQDLQRFDPASPQRELLEVLAAGLRHTQPLAIVLAGEPSAITLSVFPQEGLVHCPLSLEAFLAADLSQMRLLSVCPAVLRPPGDQALGRFGRPRGFGPLRPLLWAVAMRGARESLLPELDGRAAYRVAPAINLAGLDVAGNLTRCITMLRRQTCNLGELARWEDIGRGQAMRLLNALYLQSGLIVSRTHPAATNDGWAGY